METELAPTIRRSDYRPLPWRAVTAELHFSLDTQATVVTSRIVFERNADVSPGPIVLWGEALETFSLKLNDQPLSEENLQRFEGGLSMEASGERAVFESTVRIDPSNNTTLSGLYLSNGNFFTQCEAEGFRRITWFPDRPDNMTTFFVTLEADRATCPILLSNGNLVEKGELPEGRHYAKWEDPYPKPSYLFALVAARLVSIERHVRTASGSEVLLQVWVEEGNLDRAGHAMDSLVNAMRWDEQVFGLELDLERFMIVAVEDFNMGAMENKGLNIFNTKYVLASPDTATDADYAGIEGVVGHEYFHNWTGNRVTCRDWFQLTLKEGLTVFRDQQFSADILARAAGPQGAESARAVKRINDVRILRQAQFPEDAGPMAHPIRPDSYQAINNFYTATVYEKGAEVIRMLHTLLGDQGFREGMGLYFARHDGQAVTCDDFVKAMADANGYDLSRFMGWYAQAGTPRVIASGAWDTTTRRYTLSLTQHTPPTPDQPEKTPLTIPVKIGLMGADGCDMPLQLEWEEAAGATTRTLLLDTGEQHFHFVNLASEPVPSLLRGFSAPVILELEESNETLAFRMAHDSDPFNRWDAGQRYMERIALELAEGRALGKILPVPESFIAAFRTSLNRSDLDPAYRALLLSLPGENILLERMDTPDPAALRAALIDLTISLGERLGKEWETLIETLSISGAYRYHPDDAGKRSITNLALRYLAAAGYAECHKLVRDRFYNATNMTDRFGALSALVQSASPDRAEAMQAFYRRYQHDPLVLDKWFSLQAAAWRWNREEKPTLATVRALTEHPAFSISNPNKVYALLGTFFRGNPAEFHLPDGSGYVFWADKIIQLDSLNPQVAARMARMLENWRIFSSSAQKLIRPQLERVLGTQNLSSDVSEIISKALAN